MSFAPAAFVLTSNGDPASLFMDLLQHVPAIVNPIQSILMAYILLCVPQVLRVALSACQPSEKGGYDNVNPRVQVDRLSKISPMVGRLQACHMNGFESLQVWSAGVILAVVTGVDAQFTSKVATIYILARVVFTVFYVLGAFTLLSAVRSGAWILSTYCCMLLIGMAAAKKGEVLTVPFLS